MIAGVRVVLASTSPRRAQLLRALGVDFESIDPAISEDADEGMEPAQLVEHLALRKAASVSQRRPRSLVLGADTIVVVDGRVLGKPKSGSEAEEMLQLLRGRTHVVYTGVALLHRDSDRQAVAHEKTLVTFTRMSDDEIKHYVAGGSPMDKAGAYGIQEDLGAVFVSGIEGDYYCVMGLPVHRLYQMLKSHFPEFVSLRSRLEPSSSDA